jgi:membrane-associated protein
MVEGFGGADGSDRWADANERAVMIDSALNFVDGFLEILQGLDPLLLALATALFTALETTALIGMVVPGDAAVLLAGSTVDSPGRFALMMAGGAVGTYTGELVGYAIGYAIGPRLRNSRFGHFIGERRWIRAEKYLSGRGAPVLVPARFVSVVHAVTPVVAGTVRMPLRLFAFWAGVGALLWSGAYTAFGTAVGAAYREYRGLGLLITTVIVGVSALTVYIRRWLRRRRVSGSADGPRSDRQPDRPPGSPGPGEFAFDGLGPGEGRPSGLQLGGQPRERRHGDGDQFAHQS